MVTCTGHIGIHEGADGRTYVRCTDVHDVMAIKPNFLWYGAPRARAFGARGAPLKSFKIQSNVCRSFSN